MYTDDILSVNSLADGCLSSFLLVAVVNSAAMNVSVYIFFEALPSLLLNIYLKVELLDHPVVLFFNFWGAFVLFITGVAPLYSFTDNVQDLLQNLFTSLPILIVCFLLFLILAIIMDMRWSHYTFSTSIIIINSLYI